MRRRIFLAALALGGVSAALIVGIAPAVGKPSTPPHIVQMTCKFTLTTEPPAGSDNVVPPQQKGNQDGSLTCPNASFASGAIRTNYTIPGSGDTVGYFTQYFDTGALAGHFRLVPHGGTFGGGTYQAQNYGGQFQVTLGTGAYSGVKSSTKGTGYCTSPDSVHLSCTENLWLYDPHTTISS